MTEELETPLNREQFVDGIETSTDTQAEAKEIHGFLCPPDSILVEVFFEEGPLGVTLHRRQDGVVIVFQIVDGSQAVNMDIADGDELWAVADRNIEQNPLNKADWQEVVDFIRRSERPLRIVFRRRFTEAEEGDTPDQGESNANSNSGEVAPEPESDNEDEDINEEKDESELPPGSQLYTHRSATVSKDSSAPAQPLSSSNAAISSASEEESKSKPTSESEEDKE